MSLKKLTAQIASAGIGATLVFGLTATDAHADTAGVKLELDQSVSFVADRQGHLFFGSGTARPGILVTDGSGITVARIDTPGISDLALAPDGSALYAAATGSTQILKIDPVSLAVVATYQLQQPQCPTSVAVVGSHVAFGYSCNGQWGGVGFLNLAAPTAPPVTVSSGSYYNPLVRAVPGQSKVLVADQGLSPTGFTVVQIADGAATVQASSSSPNCANLSDLAMSPDGLTFTPACGSPYIFGRFSLATFTQIGTFAANPYPNAAAYSADGEHFAGGMNGMYDKDVVEYQLSNTATPSLLYSIDHTLGDASFNGAPRGVAFSADGSRLYSITQNTSVGNVVLHSMPASGLASTRGSDFNTDGFTDLVARNTAGTLWLYPGNGSGGFQARRQMGTGWNIMTAIITPGDVTGDGDADILGRDSAGRLWLYPGNGVSGLGTRRQIGSGWGSYTITSAGNLNTAGRPDLLARDSAGVLWLYPLSGNAAFGTRTRIGAGWNGYTIRGPGDISGDGRADVLARDASGRLWLYRGNGAGGFAARTFASSGWQAMTALITPGNWDLAGGHDLIARDSLGRLWLSPGNNAGGFGTRRLIGTGWNGYLIN